ncbi:ribonuclease HIII [Mycoplasmopsis gallinarum]|uniref:Ribonuclease n=1 Tax=Mycoplasmopsis gallinarum TaxID=29557 RepID=A0A168RQM0_9BACT|nr:ribonuclease HIII [Mycoplasmopsis gallinarum]OAB49198.1 Ribonuclease HIII [Mycoplasmopsis gallinarum]
MQIKELDIDLNSLDNLSIIGVDEVGVGDYFGPLVSSAVFIPREKMHFLSELGIKDSKKISDKKIKELAPIIQKNTINQVFFLSPHGYNQLNLQYNSNELKMFCHLNTISKVANETTSDFVLIDQFSTLKSIKNYYQKIMVDNNWAKIPNFNTDINLLKKAENYSLAVACASILARNFFLNYMKQMNEEYKINFPLGAGNQVKEFAQKLFMDKNINPKKVAKIHFKMN